MTERGIAIVKRSVLIAGHSTSVSLEAPFWSALKHIARYQKKSLNALITEIDAENPANLSSALRCHVLAHYMEISSNVRN